MRAPRTERFSMHDDRLNDHEAAHALHASLAGFHVDRIVLTRTHGYVDVAFPFGPDDFASLLNNSPHLTLRTVAAIIGTALVGSFVDGLSPSHGDMAVL